jgi:predicted small secreted protein
MKRAIGLIVVVALTAAFVLGLAAAIHYGLVKP